MPPACSLRCYIYAAPGSGPECVDPSVAAHLCNGNNNTALTAPERAVEALLKPVPLWNVVVDLEEVAVLSAHSSAGPAIRCSSCRRRRASSQHALGDCATLVGVSVQSLAADPHYSSSAFWCGELFLPGTPANASYFGEGLCAPSECAAWLTPWSHPFRMVRVPSRVFCVFSLLGNRAEVGGTTGSASTTHMLVACGWAQLRPNLAGFRFPGGQDGSQEEWRAHVVSLWMCAMSAS
jgi:hypothetical protein